MNPPIELRGHGLVLREFTRDDALGIVDLFSDPDTVRWYPLVDGVVGEDDARAYLERSLQAHADGVRIHFAVTLDSGRPLGDVMLNVPAKVIGGTIAPDVRRQGVAKRAVRLLVEFACAELQLPFVLAQIEPDNKVPIRVIEALGFYLTDAEPDTFEHAGRAFTVLTWRRDLRSVAD